jgi:hypothetical protein
MMQFTAPSSAAGDWHWSTRAAASALCGMVTDSPANPSARMPARAAGAWPGATSKASDIQLSPNSAKAVLCSSGDSE